MTNRAAGRHISSLCSYLQLLIIVVTCCINLVTLLPNKKTTAVYIIAVRLTKQTLPRQYAKQLVRESRETRPSFSARHTLSLFPTYKLKFLLRAKLSVHVLNCYCFPTVKLKCVSTLLSLRYALQGFLWFWLCQSCTSWMWSQGSQKSALGGFHGNEKISKKDVNVASLAAFFPSSGIHWGLATHFLLEPFPVRLGITRPSISCPCALWTEKPQTVLQSCPSAQGQLHTHSLIL